MRAPTMMEESECPAISSLRSRRKRGASLSFSGPQLFSKNRGLSTLTLASRLALQMDSAGLSPLLAMGPLRSSGSLFPVFPS